MQRRYRRRQTVPDLHGLVSMIAALIANCQTHAANLKKWPTTDYDHTRMI